MDADETASMLRSLGDDDVRPPMVDLDLAIQTGRRRLRRRRVAGTASSTAAVVALIAAAPFLLQLAHGNPPTSEAPAGPSKTGAATTPTNTATSAQAGPTSLSCGENRLATPRPNQEGLVGGADPTGRYMVGRVDSGSRPTQVAIWDNGKLTAFTIPGDDADLLDVNSAGVAIGQSNTTGMVSAGWIYANGKLSKLPGSGGLTPLAINEQGTIVGAQTTQTKDGLEGYPIVWHSATSDPVRLPLPANVRGGDAADVDDDGTIVGGATQQTTGTQTAGGLLTEGLVWRTDGSIEVLALPTDLVDGVNGLEIHSIRHGVITADATITSTTGKRLVPVTYDLSTRRYTVLPGANIWIGRGNATGAIAGQMNDTPAVYTPTTGVVYLPVLRTKKAAQVATGAMAATISDSGLILGGQDVDDNDVIHAVTWTCH